MIPPNISAKIIWCLTFCNNFAVCLEAAKLVDKFFAEESSHFYIFYFVEWRIEAASVVRHFHEVAEIDDMFLAYAHELAVKCEYDVACYAAFEFYGLLHCGYDNFPHTHVVVVGEHAYLAYVDESEVDGIGVDDEFAVVATGDAVVGSVA